jgi:hypothetical protein
LRLNLEYLTAVFYFKMEAHIDDIKKAVVMEVTRMLADEVNQQVKSEAKGMVNSERYVRVAIYLSFFTFWTLDL